MPASRPARGREALRYNALQKFAYLAVLLVLFPLMVLTGLTMSPGVTAAYPELFTLFGGRQSARTLHFLAACLLVLFLVVHVAQVFVGGAGNLMRVDDHRTLPRSAGDAGPPRRPPMRDLSRRRLLAGSGSLLGAGLLGGCDAPALSRLATPYDWSNGLTFAVQRWLQRHQPLVREFGPEAISAVFPTINTTDPDDPDYRRSKALGFSDWTLAGQRPRGAAGRRSRSPTCRAMPARTQITLHSCEQGWSAIGGWTGVPLAHLLAQVGLKPEARFIVVRSVDGWWDSYDLFDALHPQTILAYGMNGGDLPVAHGAPVRLRVERQLGYKSLKYVSAIEAVERVDGLGKGRGSMVAELGFPWYAGI